MAYAGHSGSRPGARAAREARETHPAPDLDSTASRNTEDDTDDIDEPGGRPYIRSLEWADAGVFGAGIAVGVLIGAGAALLFAPQSGSETRDDIMRGTRDFGVRATDAWDDLRDELRHVATRGAKRLRRGVRRGRHSTEDLVGTVRRHF